jgi:hypothetical protein
VTDDVPDRYALSFLIGEVVRNDVGAESEMRMLWWRLRQAGLVDEKMERDLGRLVKQVRCGLRDPAVPAEFGRIALDVLERTWTAHRLRNELVHDHWVNLPWDATQIRSMRSASPRQLSDLRACAADLLTLTWRLRGVAVIAPAWLGTEDHDDDEPLSDDDAHSWTRVAMGHIADDPGRVAGTPGPAPLLGR